MKIRSLFVLILLAVGFVACDKESSTPVIIRLTDSPGDYDAVNIDLVEVQIHRGNGDEGGWESLDTNEGIYNLLDLTDGVETVIVNSQVPAGEITQIRLVLGPNNTVEIDGEVFELKTPSAQQSGLKLNLNELLIEGITYTLLLDFDAAKSVVETGNGKFILKPVVRTISEALDGAITGTVLPAEENVAVYAIIGEDTLGTSYAIENNESWFIGGLQPGTYTIGYDPGELSTYGPTVVDGVEVTLGEIKDLGETSLELK